MVVVVGFDESDGVQDGVGVTSGDGVVTGEVWGVTTDEHGDENGEDECDHDASDEFHHVSLVVGWLLLVWWPVRVVGSVLSFRGGLIEASFVVRLWVVRPGPQR